MKKITVTSVFDAPPEAVWEKLLDLETLMTICKPRARFRLISGNLAEDGRWQEGIVYKFRLWLHGFIPMGVHEIVLERIDVARMEIQSRERNRIVTVWNHLIILRRTDDNKTLYTDEVELYAGVFTRPAVFWSRAFYRHRQRRWQQILSERRVTPLS